MELYRHYIRNSESIVGVCDLDGLDGLEGWVDGFRAMGAVSWVKDVRIGVLVPLDDVAASISCCTLTSVPTNESFPILSLPGADPLEVTDPPECPSPGRGNANIAKHHVNAIST